MRPFLMLKTYAWVINMLRDHGPISREDLLAKWKELDLSKDCCMVRQTFWKYRNDIEEFFHITISRDSQNRYYIEEGHALEQDTVQNFMLSAVTVTSTLSEYKEIHDRIILEEIPSSGRFFKEIVEAMNKNETIIINYQRYDEGEMKEHTLNPYYLKLYKRRWYMLAEELDGEKRTMKLFGLDRIMSLTMTSATFKMNKRMSAREYFKDCYGVMRDETKPAERIVLRAFGTEANYMRDLKMHSSQREIFACDDYSDFELYVRPSKDVVGQILERGDRLKVLEPEHLAQEIMQKHLDSVNIYKK